MTSIEPWDVDTGLMGFVLKQVAAFPAALMMCHSDAWVLLGTGRGSRWETGAPGTWRPP